MRQILSTHISHRGLQTALFTKGKKVLGLSACRSIGFEESPFKNLPVGVQVADVKSIADAIQESASGLPECRTTLVLPDAWLRSTVLTVEDLPRRHEEIRNLLSWRLKKVLNAEPGDLRFSYNTMAKDVKGESRLLVNFALEKLLDFFEQTYASINRDVGNITSHFWSLASRVVQPGSWGLLTLEESLWNIGFFKGEELLFFRQKLLAPNSDRQLPADIEQTWNYFYKRWDTAIETLYLWQAHAPLSENSTLESLTEPIGCPTRVVDLSGLCSVEPSVRGGEEWESYQSVIIGAAQPYV